MTRETFKLIVAIGVLITGPLYLVLLAIAGLVLGRPPVYCLAIAALGVTYLSYVFHLASTETGDWSMTLAQWLVYLSLLLGILAGVSLLIFVLVG